MKKMIAASIVAAGILSTVAITPKPSYAAPASSINMEEVIKFQKESAGLRGEIVVKKLDLIGEATKQPSDPARIKTVAREVIDLQNKIGALANKHGLPGPSAFQSVIRNLQTDLTDAERKAILEAP